MKRMFILIAVACLSLSARSTAADDKPTNAFISKGVDCREFIQLMDEFGYKRVGRSRAFSVDYATVEFAIDKDIGVAVHYTKRDHLVTHLALLTESIPPNRSGLRHFRIDGVGIRQGRASVLFPERPATEKPAAKQSSKVAK